MIPTKPHRLLLFVSGLVAAGIGAALLLDPLAFHATNGITLGSDPSLLSELRAPGGLLLALGLVILSGAFRAARARTATLLSALLYLSYGGARLVSLGLDGVPADGLVLATAIELGLGLPAAIYLLRDAGHGAERSARTPGRGSSPVRRGVRSGEAS